jgi:ankyrin repeat protein
MSMLMHACKINHPELAELLLACPGINPHKLNWWGKNAAMVAHEQGSIQLFLLLAQAGISRHPVNPALPLYEKLRGENNDVRCAKLMKQLTELITKDHYVSLRDENGMTLLLLAVRDGEFAVVDTLYKLKPVPNILIRDVDGKSASDYAAGIDDDESRSDIVRCLHALRRDFLGTVGDLQKGKNGIALESTKNA